MRAPSFWSEPAGPRAWLLAPIAALVTRIGAWRRLRTTPHRVSIPVLCVGNLVAGGAGKTPIAIALVRRLQEMGHTPHLLSRGYKGRLKGPLLVDRKRHSAADVGDEPLLHARYCPTWIGADRAVTAERAKSEGATVVVMDDGFQNPGLAKDVSFLVIDGQTGLGNGRVIPAGPLREPPEGALARAQAVILMGDDEAGIGDALANTPLPVLRARLEPAPQTRSIAGQPVVAFAGIGRPEKFFKMLDALGCRIVHRFAYDDHQAYGAEDLDGMLDLAAAAEALLVTTSKDWVRLSPAYRRRVHRLPVEAVFEKPEVLAGLLPSRDE